MPHTRQVDLSNCDREPIHVPGSIQTHGCLFVCDPSAVEIRRHSVNAGAFLGIEGPFNGRKLEDILDRVTVHNLRNALARSGDPSRPGLMMGVAVHGKPTRYDLSVHRHDGQAIIEIEEAAQDGTTSPLEFTRTLIRRMGKFSTIDRLVRDSAKLLRAVLQYDRVMIYRFAADGSGKVVSEAKRSDLESFLGQHFPASDIPQQARRLYIANPIRIVGDASGSRVMVEPILDESGAPLDLSFAHLRSVSPIHCEYLRNMGVGASMSVSIIVGGELWGLIACHHYAPRSLSMNHRIAAEIFGEFFSLQLDALTQRDKAGSAERARAFLDHLLDQAHEIDDVGAFIRDRLPEFPGLIESDGVGLWIDGIWSAVGSTPPQEHMPDLVAFLGAVAEGRIWSTHRMTVDFPAAEAYHAQASGMIAVPLSRQPGDYLMFFRKELVETVEWGGDPNKQYESGPLGDRLTPRKSFAIWKETVDRQSKPWTESDLGAAESARSALVEVVLHHTQLLADEKRKADLRQKILNEELNHRVKNILALIKSLVSQPVEAGRGIEGYVDSLKGRIGALAVAHDQIARGSGGGALADLLGAELSPYREVGDISLSGPPLLLDGRAYSVMALVLHELATNAAKYGALSRSGGRLAIGWGRADNGDGVLTWHESGGPTVSAPSRRGFGSVLIERSIAHDLGGRSEIAFEPAGLRATVTLPAGYLSWLADPAASGAAQEQAGLLQPGQPLEGLDLLVVEDQFLIAMDIETSLQDGGAARVEICATVAEALERLRSFKPDRAVLDIQLASETTVEVALRLKADGVPFVFASGFGDPDLPSELASVPLVRKPFTAKALLSALSSLDA